MLFVWFCSLFSSFHRVKSGVYGCIWQCHYLANVIAHSKSKKRKFSSRTATFIWQQMHSNHPIYKIRICRNIIVDHNFPAESQSDVVTWIKNLLEDTNCLPLHSLQSIVRVKGKSKSYLLLRDEVLHRGSCGCLELPIAGMNRFFKSNNVPNWTTTAATQRGGQELLKRQMLP